MKRALLLGLAFAVGCSKRSAEPDVSSDPAPKVESVQTSTRTARLVEAGYGAMGTQVGFQAWTDEPERARGAFEAAMAEIRRLEDLHSNWRPNSDVSRLNARAGVRPVPVADETIELLQLARRMHQMTAGKFDVTFGALSDLWRFDHDQDNRIPDPARVAERLPLVDASLIQVSEERGEAFLPLQGMKAHLGGIGKGYAVDRAVSVLRQRGLQNFVIKAGGDMFASGQRGDRAWRVGVRDPRGAPEQVFAVAELRDRTFSTSGDYERFFVKDGRRYHHILDPDSGMPATGVRSVTVLAPKAVIADALSTAVFLLGETRGMALVESIPTVSAVMVTAENNVRVSERAASFVTVVRNPTP